MISSRFIFSSLFLTQFGLGECSPSSRKTFIISVTDGGFELKFCDFHFLCIGDISWKKKSEKPFCLRGKRGALSDGGIFSQIIYFWGNIIKIFNTFQSKWRIYHTVTLLVIISVIMEKIIFSLISLLVQKTRDLSGKTTVLKIMITSSWWSRNEGRYLYIF